jgi:cytochrome c-type biogenesis protein CcmH
MRQGRSDKEVVEYLTARYGDFVLYRPPFKPATYLLGIGPALFLGAGGITWFLTIRRRQRASRADRTDDSRGAAAAPFSGEDRN